MFIKTNLWKKNIFILPIMFFIMIVSFYSNCFAKNFISSFIENEIVSNKNIKCHIEDISFHYNTIQIKNIYIYDSKNNIKLNIKEVDFNLTLMFVFFGRITLKNIKIINPEVWINAENNYVNYNSKNINELLNQVLKIKNFSFYGNLEIVNGTINICRKNINIFKNIERYTINHIDLLVTKNIFKNYFFINSKGSINFYLYGGEVSEKFEFKTKLKVNFKKHNIIINNLELFTNDTDCLVKGKILDFNKSNFIVDLFVKGSAQAKFLKHIIFILMNRDFKIPDFVKTLDDKKCSYSFNINNLNNSNSYIFYMQGNLDFDDFFDSNCKCFANFLGKFDVKKSVYDFTNLDFYIGESQINSSLYLDENIFSFKYKTLGDGLKLDFISQFFSNKLLKLNGNICFFGEYYNGKNIININLKDVFYEDKINKIDSLNSEIIIDDLDINIAYLKCFLNSHIVDCSLKMSKNNYDNNFIKIHLSDLNLSTINLDNSVSNIFGFFGFLLYKFYDSKNMIQSHVLVDKLYYNDLCFSNNLFNFSVKNNISTIDFSSIFNDGKLFGNIDADLNKFVLTKNYLDILFKGNCSAQNIKIDGIVKKKFKQPYDISGVLNCKFDFEYFMNKFSIFKSDFGFTDGELINFVSLKKVLSFINGIDYLNIKYKTITMKLSYIDKIINIYSCKILTQYVDADIFGNLDFVNRLMDLDISCNLNGTKNKLNVSGNFDHPNYNLDFPIANLGQSILNFGSKILQDLVK